MTEGTNRNLRAVIRLRRWYNFYPRITDPESHSAQNSKMSYYKIPHIAGIGVASYGALGHVLPTSNFLYFFLVTSEPHKL